MTNIDRAAEIIAESITRDSAPAHEIVADLEHDGLLMPEPQIIRTVEELEALDHDTLVWLVDDQEIADVGEILTTWRLLNYRLSLPAVVIATADQVRAAREALEEA